tara:strand:- start:3499 stop:4809 length:1311 start_codon:yes stop_codon:yes gene_type:complete
MELTSRPRRERAIIIQIEFGFNKRSSEPDLLEEFTELVCSSGANILETILGKQDKPIANYFIKSGKLAEIKLAVNSHDADLVIFNHDLSPSQERNLEKYLCKRVLDRTGLILDIFASRARSHTGKLQVELAQLNHLATRLVRGWSHLERQKGGIGLRGPGETQLETDRRLLALRVKSLKKRISRVHSQKKISRYARAKGNTKLVGILGYTNVGKTTLFNLLTGDEQLVANKPFATLDSITRRSGNKKLKGILFSDTVGFISNLPTHLIESFKATLDELKAADILLHIVDVSDANYKFKVSKVNKLIKDLDLEYIDQIIVYNKSDLIEARDLFSILKPEQKKVWVSAKRNLGINALEEAINFCIYGDKKYGWLFIKPSYTKIRADLFSRGRVIEEGFDSSGLIQLRVELGSKEIADLVSVSGIDFLENEPTLVEVNK